MSRSNWRNILAAVGVLALAALIWETGQLYYASQQRHADYSYQPAGHPSLLQAMPGKTVAQGYKPNCKNPQTKEDSDLCAQWASVEQVTESNRLSSLNGRLAIVTVWGTILGTVMLVWTLIETRDTSRRELRAYIFAENVGIYALVEQSPQSENGKVGGTIVIKNSGQTPAYDVAHWCELTLHPFADEAQLAAPPLVGCMTNTLPPGGQMHAARRMQQRLTRKQQQQLREGVLTIYVYGRIEYRDAFNRAQSTNYKFAYAAWPLLTNLTMHFASTGNEAT